MIAEKPCYRCGEVKPLAEFYTHPRMTDGHLNKCAECCRVDAKEHRDTFIERIRAYDRERGLRIYDPAKVEARRLVHEALKRGELEKQPCEVCGKTEVQAHHEDHSRPLDVIWLCRRHHGVAHRRVGGPF